MKFPFIKKLDTKFAILVLAAMFGFVQYSSAQSGNGGWLEDPLKKPELWKILVKSPTDSTAWVKYYGKAWSAMTIKDLEKIGAWKQELMLRQLADQEAVVGFRIPDNQEEFFIDEAAFNEMMTAINQAKSKTKSTTGSATGTAGAKVRHVTRAEIAGMEAIILQERTELSELRSNIHANFAMIEEIYSEIFKEFNIEYVYYKQKHPDGKYGQVKWVEDHEKKLKELKMKQVEELRKIYKPVDN